jgi:shikimate dehydrogenase
MKKFLVIGNPIDHSLSPKLHNYWIKSNGINAIYEKKKLDEDELEHLVFQIKQKKIDGVNVTVPFKKAIIPFLDELTIEAKSTQSVNTLYLKDNRVMGHNTDIIGFETSIKESKFNIFNKKVLIFGAGGVVSSIIFALNKMKVSNIKVSNRTREKAENLKKLFKNIEIIDWGEVPNSDVIINATSIGLKKEDQIKLDFSSISKNSLFYDVIYNPRKTNFLKIGKKMGNMTLNGKLMFVYQAFSAFNIWHGIEPNINEDIMKLIDE